MQDTGLLALAQSLNSMRAVLVHAVQPLLPMQVARVALRLLISLCYQAIPVPPQTWDGVLRLEQVAPSPLHLVPHQPHLTTVGLYLTPAPIKHQDQLFLPHAHY